MKKQITKMLLTQFVMCAMISTTASAQTDVLVNPSALASLGGPQAITFKVTNNNANAIQVQKILYPLLTGIPAGTYTLYHSTTDLTGNPNLSAGWTTDATVSLGAVSTSAYYYIFTGLTINIPAGSTYRFAVGVATGGTLVYGGSGSTPTSATSADNVFLNTGIANGAGVRFTPPNGASAQRNYAGGVSYVILIANDRKITNIYTYGSLPIPYSNANTISTNIKNSGTNAMPSSTATLTVSGANSFSDTQTIPALASGASAVVTFASFSNAATGTNTINVAIPADDDNSNNSSTMTQPVTANLYSYKYTAPITGGVGFNAGIYGVFVSKFSTSIAAQINEVKVDFQASTASRQFRLAIYSESGGLPGTLLYSSPSVITITSAAQQAFIAISPTVSLSPGNFFVGIIQETSNTVNIGFSYQTENPSRIGTFFFANALTGPWTDFGTPTVFPYRSAIEVQFYIPVPPNCAILNAPADLSMACTNGTTLTWGSGGGGPTGYKVYFGTNQALVQAENNSVLVQDNFTTSYTTGTLSNGSTYYWKVVAYNVDGTASSCGIRSFTANLISCYCTSAATNGGFEFISNVASGAYSNSSASGLYQDFTGTGIVNNVQLNSTFNVSVTITNPYDEDKIYVFVDFNHDGDFNDAGELAGTADPFGGVGTGTDVEQVTITVPVTALAGNTVMRIKMGDEIDPVTMDNNPCQTYTYGEVEDYLVNVLPCGTTASSNSPVCQNGTINLTSSYIGTGTPVSYSWVTTAASAFTSGSPNPSISGVTSANDAGVYTVSITDNTGCTSTASVTIGVTASPSPNATSNSPLCEGSTLTLFGDNVASGQSSGNSWSWSGPSYSSSAQNPTITGATLSAGGTYTLTVTNSNGCTASTTTNVVINPNPVISIASQTGVSCNGDADGTVDIDASVGSSPYFYYLDNSPSANGIYTGLTPGPHNADVTDDNGCVAPTLVVTIAEPPVLTVSAGSNTPVCSGNPLNLNSTPGGGTAGYSYAWTGPNGAVPAVQNPTIASATVADGGQYNLQITDAHGCTATSSHMVTVNASPTAAIAVSGSANKCLGQSATVQLTFTSTAPWTYTVSGSGGPYSATTSNNPESVNVTPAAAGTQNYTVTSIGNTTCPTTGTGSGTATVYVSTGPPTNTAAIPVPASNEACVNTVMLITCNTITGQNIFYSWNTGTNSSVVLFSTNIGGPFSAGPFQTSAPQVYAQFGALTGSNSGYNVCVQGLNGCGSTNNRCVFIRGTVSVPGTITPPAGVVACANTTQSYSCGASGGASVYSWTLNGATAPITSGQGTQNVSVLFPNGFTSGNLCVTASLACGGSSTSAARCMSISNNPAIPATIIGAASVCPGATGVPYSVPAVSGASGYFWSIPVGATIASGANTPSITVNFPASFSGASSVCVAATSACGSSVARCKSVSSGIPNQPAGVNGPTTNVCNSTVQYSVVNPPGGVTYTWTNPAGTTIQSGQGNSTILLNVSGTFSTGVLSVVANSVLCAPANSPARTITIFGKPNMPGVETANPVSFCNGGSVNFSVPNVIPSPAYSWTVSNGTITAGQGSNNIDVTWGAGTGNVAVTASNGCGASTTRTQSFTGISCREEGMSASANFSVYPNPAHDKLTVSIDANEQTNFAMQLSDIAGRVVLSENKAAAEGLNLYELDLSHLSKGVYTLEMNSSAGNRMVKVVVE